MSTQNKSSKNTLIIGIILLLSIIANIYQWNNHTTTVVQYGKDVDSLVNVRIAVERELASTAMELEKYRGIASNLDSLLNDANTSIAKQENRIRQLLSSEKNAKKLNKKLQVELAELKKLRDEYLDKIDGLMAENKALKLQNEDLNKQVGDLNETKNQLQAQVNTASRLKTEYVKITAFKKKSSGKLVESALAKKTNKIEVCYTIMDNKVAQAGDRSFYLRIIAPNNKPLMGYTHTEMKTNTGEIMDMTASQKINFSGEKQNMCLAYENEERNLESGTYTVEIYIDGEISYSSSIVLR